jgi:hypothetical protein
MKFAIATHSFLVVVELDQDWTIKNHKVLGKGYHYGMTMTDEDWSGQNRSGEQHLVVYRGGDHVSQQNDCRLMIYNVDQSFQSVDSIPLNGNFGDVHQLSYANNGLYLVNSKYNSLVFKDFEKNTQIEYSIDNVDYDKNHLNSVYPCGDKILVMLHNKGRLESQLAAFKHVPGEGFKLECLLSLWHYACHNVFLDEHHLLYNASPVHSLIKVDINSKKIVKELNFKGHSKGLSVTSDYIVVGLSEDTFRDRRSVSKGQLVIIDRKTFSIAAVVDLNLPTLPHPIGNINEVRCLSESELANSRPGGLDIECSDLRLAEDKLIQHWLRRMKFKSMLPVRRFKTNVRKYI